MRVLLFTYVILCPLLWAQDNLDDSLFGGDSIIESPSEDTQDATNTDDSVFGGSFISEASSSEQDTSNALLEQDDVSIGGNLSFGLGAGLQFSPEDDTIPEEDRASVFTSNAARVDGRLYLDARPSSTMRFLIKTDLGYSAASGTSFGLHEAFIDTDINKQWFIRAGKQTINWGVGPIFRPANLMSLESFDRDNPERELSGPVAIKVQYPMRANNLTGYAFTASRDGENTLGLAALYEYLVQGYELTSGARWVVGNNPWAVMTTAQGSLASPIGRLALRAEVVLEGNIDKRFVVADAQQGIRAEQSDAVFFSGEFGVSYYNSDNEDLPFALSAAYAFNGKGYADNSILEDNAERLPLLIATDELSFSDLTRTGQHYASLGASLPDIADLGLSLSSSWFGNLSDGSGTLGLNLTYRNNEVLSKYVTPRLSYRYNYGSEYSEFGQGDRYRLRLRVDVGLGGSF